MIQLICEVIKKKMSIFDEVISSNCKFIPYWVVIRGCSLMMSYTEGGGVRQKVIFHGKGRRGCQAKSDFW